MARRYVKNSTCMECHRLSNAQLYKSNAAEILEKQKSYYAANVQAFRKWRREYYRRNAERAKQYAAEWNAKNRDKSNSYKKKHKIDNPGMYRALDAERRARLIDAMPPWADKAKINALYEQAQAMTRQTGVRYSVDHVIPLVHRQVCGLHVETNLQVVPLADNLKKNNLFMGRCS